MPTSNQVSPGVAVTVSIASGSVEQAGLERLRVDTHGLLVQEWYHFLADVFQRAVLHALERRSAPRLLMKVDLQALDWDKLTTVRATLANHLRDVFADDPYDLRIRNLKKLCRVSVTPRVQQRLKTHRVVRNVFEHSRGKLRARDIDDLPDSVLKLRGGDGGERTFGEGQTIELSLHDVTELRHTIVGFSAGIEVLS